MGAWRDWRHPVHWWRGEHLAIQILPDPPGVSLWPFWPLSALVLVDIAVLGLAGFSGVALDNQPHSLPRVRVTWIACGGLTALAIIGAFGVSIVVLSVVPALLFGGAAMLTDIRRG